MEKQNFIHDFQQKLLEMFRASPAADLERNIKALMGQTFNKLELVTRDEFEIQVELLRSLRLRVEALEARVEPKAGEATGPEPWTAGEQAESFRSQSQASDSSRTSRQDQSSEPFGNPTPS